MVYTLRFFFLSSKCSLFHNSNVFGSCIIHILYTGCAKIKKNNSGAKRLINALSPRPLYIVRIFCVPFMNVNWNISTASRDMGDRYNALHAKCS